ncbi:hypothetical protein PhaeoP83_01642 [Phaeobacter inhibens]|uniref:Uncharacterized protein n=1 Tax=Phaeobacter inhibens TaxID=221822 RepID=A0ABM6RDP4_9RHOB|nr:hypothetical protein [Phaeobacter inhibens]AUQ49916.1 hypothetical protein PhaeoP83_01642 [Phaeobacter inhibens]AUQ94471.1 hypothetical protein PhaeoP66_01689 [Phaeobacter inhibens]AUR19721.1 hypothetical protein PhaeoP80_01642 [Phaeobacter inhibens]UWR51408.1 hypothetical protein K4F84_09205 [Phaeobacter inhibens]UWR66928.1 hypothetical protein K4K95_09090 [Phaeobacter inhibens]
MSAATTAARFAQTIAQLQGRERRDAVACAVIETGGLYPFPFPKRALVEIQLHGVCATGIGEDEAISNWIDKVSPQVEPQEVAA